MVFFYTKFVCFGEPSDTLVCSNLWPFWFGFYKPKINNVPVAVSKRFNGLRVAPAQKRRNMFGPFEWILLNEVESLHDMDGKMNRV